MDDLNNTVLARMAERGIDNPTVFVGIANQDAHAWTGFIGGKRVTVTASGREIRMSHPTRCPNCNSLHNDKRMELIDRRIDNALRHALETA